MDFHLQFPEIQSNYYMHNKYKYKNVDPTPIYFNIYIAILFYSKDKMYNQVNIVINNTFKSLSIPSYNIINNLHSI